MGLENCCLMIGLLDLDEVSFGIRGDRTRDVFRLVLSMSQVLAVLLAEPDQTSEVRNVLA